jgi:hypothetical protein
VDDFQRTGRGDEEEEFEKGGLKFHAALFLFFAPIFAAMFSFLIRAYPRNTFISECPVTLITSVSLIPFSR